MVLAKSFTDENVILERALNAEHRAEVYAAVSQYAIHTALTPSSILSGEKAGEIRLKLENIQRTGSFKFRGAYNKLRLLTPTEKAKGVIAASAGNHAQGVALASKMLGIKARIFMPEAAPKTKVEATANYGAEVVLVGKNFDETKEMSLKESERTGEVFISPFDDLDVIEGQGTIGTEILADWPDVDNVIVPIGGGGLIAGIALAMKTVRPEIHLIGVQSFGVHGMISSIWNNQLVHNRTYRTLADGCDVAFAGELTYEILKDYIDETVLVEEDEIRAAIEYLLKKEKVLAEGAGALTTAAILSGSIDHLLQGQKTVAVVSGGNIDIDLLKSLV
ncbi:pyridoxal-phosphate dependent enzyme [Enterococcus nangangensis]|uniref:pyridoxal-phosphate dependent enzyme n=1 Tax=Enterococcus nangangensis TaxID=2559926 RepID=UPI0010F767D0|nr:pyridoxal-phosphate dependent enzyme [Enterococcus nangangensis]